MDRARRKSQNASPVIRRHFEMETWLQLGNQDGPASNSHRKLSTEVVRHRRQKCIGNTFTKRKAQNLLKELRKVQLGSICPPMKFADVVAAKLKLQKGKVDDGDSDVLPEWIHCSFTHLCSPHACQISWEQ